MGSERDIFHIEGQQGFAGQRGYGETLPNAPAQRLPWQELLDALEEADVERARQLYRRLMASHPEWQHPPLTEVGTLLASANHQAALALLKTLRSPAAAARVPAAAPEPSQHFFVRGGADQLDIVGLRIDRSA